MKKVIIILILAIAGIAAYFLFFSKEGVSFSKETSIYKAVPMDAPMFLELKSIKGLPLGKTIAQEIKKAGLFTYVFQKAEFLDTLVSGNKDIGNSVLNSPLVIAFTLEGKKKPCAPFGLKSRNKFEEKTMQLTLSKRFLAPIIQALKDRTTEEKLPAINHRITILNFITRTPTECFWRAQRLF